MGVSAATGTFPSAIKPVGEALPLNFRVSLAVPAGNGASPEVPGQIERNYDFLVNRNYVVTGLRATKTVAALGVEVVETIGVYKVTPGPDSTASQVQVAQVAFPASSLKGTTVIAGALTTGAAIAVDIAQPATAAAIKANDDANSLLDDTAAFYNGYSGDELVKVAANIPITGSSPSQQRIRIRIVLSNLGDFVTQDASCFILVSFAGYSDVRRNGTEELNRVVIAVP